MNNLLAEKEARIIEQAAHISDLQAALEHERQQSKAYAQSASEERQLRLEALARQPKKPITPVHPQASPVFLNIIGNVAGTLLAVLVLAALAGAYQLLMHAGGTSTQAKVVVAYCALLLTVLCWGHIVGSWVDKHGLAIISKAHYICYQSLLIFIRIVTALWPFYQCVVLFHNWRTKHFSNYEFWVPATLLILLCYLLGYVAIEEICKTILTFQIEKKKALDGYASNSHQPSLPIT